MPEIDMPQIHFLNVGNGDCTWIKHANGANSVIDVCLAKSNPLSKAQDAVAEMFSASTNAVKGNFNQAASPENPIEYLQQFGVNSIFRFILSHPDMDHMDGMQDFFNTFSPANFWDTTNNKPKPDFNKPCRYSESDWNFYQSIRKNTSNPKCLHLYAGAKGQYYNQGDDTRSGNGLSILAPTPSLVTDANSCGEYNDCSYVILYSYKKFKVLFCGDACNNTLNHLLKNHRSDISNIDLLIAPHHGRKGNIDFSFLDVMKPQLTFFGNANSEHLAYNEWSRRGLEKITSNQAGTLIADFIDESMNVYAKNETFAKKYNVNTFKENALDAWYLGSLSK